MSNSSPFSERLQGVFRPSSRGVVGLVDDLLGLCRERGLQLDWHTDRCRVHPLGVAPREAVELPLPKAVFRAILARMAALCNERTPDSVSPYGGEGELSFGAHPPTFFRVAFINTPGEQRLDVRREGEEEPEAVRLMERILSTLRQLEDEPIGADDCVRALLTLGPEAVAVIRDPAPWPDFEPWITDHNVAEAWLILCGAPLAQHWFFSPRPLFASEAKRWLQKNWRTCWDVLGDAVKRHLVEHFAEEALRLEAQTSGARELPMLLAAALKRFGK